VSKSSTIPTYITGSARLDDRGLVASWSRMNPTYFSASKEMGPPQFVITCCNFVYRGVLIPATSISIGSREGLIALRDAIDQALEEAGAP
jgi:hypothetical protein